MFKFFKLLLKLFVILIVVSVVLVLGITLFINPNQFKDQLEQQVLKQTGQTLKVQGPILWRWFPMLAIELNQVVIEAPAPFTKPFLSAGSARAEVELLPLLTGKVFLNLNFKELNLFLEKNNKGEANWEILKQQITTAQPKETNLEPTKTSSESSKPSRLMLNGVAIKNGNLAYKDDQNHKEYNLKNLNFSAENLFKGAFKSSTPISLSFNLEDAKSKLLGSLLLSSKLALKSNLDEVDVQKLSLKITLPSGKSAHLTGDTHIQDLNKNPMVQGHFESTNLELAALLKDLNMSSNSAIPSSLDIKSSFKYQSPKLEIASFDVQSKDLGDFTGNLDVNLGENTLQTMILKGNFSSNRLKLEQLMIEQLKGSVSGKQSVFNIAPIDFQIAKIPQHATLQLDLSGSSPRYSLTSEAQNFEINQLLASFNAKNKIEGKTRYKARLTASGNNVNEWRRSLSGQANFELANGKLYGIDLIKLLKSAQSNVYSLVSSLVKKQSFNLKNMVQTEQQKWNGNLTDPKASTPFNSVTATLNINNGLFKNPDLLVNHSEYKINGEGSFDLNSNAIDYRVAVLLKNNPYPANDQIANYLYSTPLPVKVGGTLDNPIVRPDLDKYTNDAVVYAQTHLLEKVIDKEINKAFEHLLNR